MELTMSEKQARKAMLEEIIEAENMGIHKYVDAIKMIPEHCKMLKSIMNEEFQHIKLLRELIKDLGEVSEIVIYEYDESKEHHDEEMSQSEVTLDNTPKASTTMVSFKRSK